MGTNIFNDQPDKENQRDYPNLLARYGRLILMEPMLAARNPFESIVNAALFVPYILVFYFLLAFQTRSWVKSTVGGFKPELICFA